MIRTKISAPTTSISLTGQLNCAHFEFYKDVLLQIKRAFPRLNLDINGKHESDYYEFVKGMKKNFPDTGIFAHKRSTPVIVLNNRRYISSLRKLTSILETLLGFDITCPDEERHVKAYQSQVERNYMIALQPSLNYKYCFLVIDGSSNRIVIELFNSLLPKSCENFYKLCEGFKKKAKSLSYRNNKIFKNAGNGYIVSGDTTGEGGEGIYEEDLEDENYQIRHDKPGIIGWVNKGYRHSNQSMFYITTDIMDGFDRRMVAFGRVLQGLKHVKKIAKMKREDLGLMNYKISDCGVYK